MSRPKNPPSKTNADDFSKVWLKLPPAARQWIEQAVQIVLASPLPISLVTDKLRRDAFLQSQWNTVPQDANLNFGNKAILSLMLVIQKLDADIEDQAAKLTGERSGAASIDVEMQKLKRMVDKRNQMFAVLNAIMAQHNETTKNIVQNIGR